MAFQVSQRVRFAEHGRGRTRRSAPLDFRLAQSSGPKPGAKATFSLALVGGLAVLGGSIKEFPLVRAIAGGMPNVRVPRAALGIGGSISPTDLLPVGGDADMIAGIDIADDDARCALFTAGNAGGLSSSSLSVSSPSSSSVGSWILISSNAVSDVEGNKDAPLSQLRSVVAIEKERAT